MKRDTFLLGGAFFLALLSFVVYRVVSDDGGIPPRSFPGTGYTNTRVFFGVVLSKEIILKTRKIVRNGAAISSSSGKQRYLYQELLGKLSRRYSRRRIPALFGFIDEEEEGWLFAVFLQAVDDVKSRLPEEILLPESFLFTAINNEGRIFSDYSDFGKVNDLNGFANAGLDWFSREFVLLDRLGYLPPSFRDKFEPTVRTNELGRRVPTADFFEVYSLFRAFVAVMANRQRRVVADCRALGIFKPLGRESLLFYTYLYYNAGRTYGRRLLRRLHSLKRIRGFVREKNHGGPHNNAVTVIAAAEWLRLSGVFDLHPEGRYWWSGFFRQ